MNTTELKEMLEAVVKKEGAYSAYENSYGLSDKQGFMLRKQLKIVDTSDHYKSHVDKNYLICVPSKEGFVQSPASRAKHQLKVIYADYELWVDGEKIREGTTLNEAYQKLKDSFPDIPYNNSEGIRLLLLHRRRYKGGCLLLGILSEIASPTTLQIER